MRDHVIVVGSGLMGSGIAARSALAGNKTYLTDTSLDRAEKGISAAYVAMKELYDNELCTEEQFKNAQTLLKPASPTSSVLDEAFFVIEAVYENLELKQQVFKELDEALPPDVIIASNTSGLRITEISAKTVHKERCVSTHFWFPAHLVPLVEVVMSDYTKEEYALKTKKILRSWGKAPVLVRKDLEGQLAGRIFQAVIREATNIVNIGLATPEDVDTAVKLGMGIRFPVWGPLEHIDAVGLDLCVNVQNTVLPVISSEQTASPAMTDRVAEGNLGSKTGKGIYDWTKKSMPDLMKLRNEFIIHALKKVKLPDED